MFRRREEPTVPALRSPETAERINSVLGPGITWKGSLSGRGGIRIEGAFDGDIAINGMLVVGETGRVTCEKLKADVVIIAGAVKGDIFATKIEIRKTGRVWGDVVTTAFATEEGAFLRGQITMEEKIDLGLEGIPVEESSADLIESNEPPRLPE